MSENRNPRLDEIADLIREEHEEAVRCNEEAMEHEETAGALLLAAQALCPDEEWETYVKDRCGMEEHEACNYIGNMRDDEEIKVLWLHRNGFLQPKPEEGAPAGPLQVVMNGTEN